MSNPASWFYLHALAGLVYDALEEVMCIAPHLPRVIGNGRELKELPVFLPHGWLKLSLRDEERTRSIKLVLAQKIGEGGFSFRSLRLGLPPGAVLSTLRVETDEGGVLSWDYSPATEEIQVHPDRDYRLENPGDTLCLNLCW